MAQASAKTLNEVEYKSGVHATLLILLVVVSFGVAFFTHFPFEKRIATIVKAQLAQIPGCELSFNGLHFEFFLPKVVLTDFQIPPSCLGQDTGGFNMRQVALKFRGPSFSPLGLAFKAVGDLEGTEVGINYAVGFSGQVFNIQEEALPIKKLLKFGSLPDLDGTMSVGALVAIENNAVHELKLLIESKNLIIPPQTLNDLRLPKVDLGNLLIKVESQGPKRLNVQEIVIGKADSPLRGKFKGTVELSEGPLSLSPINLTGELAVTDAFKEAFPILNLMLPQFQQKDGFYQIRIGGTLGQLQPSSL